MEEKIKKEKKLVYFILPWAEERERATREYERERELRESYERATREREPRERERESYEKERRDGERQYTLGGLTNLSDSRTTACGPCTLLHSVQASWFLRLMRWCQ